MPVPQENKEEAVKNEVQQKKQESLSNIEFKFGARKTVKMGLEDQKLKKKGDLSKDNLELSNIYDTSFKKKENFEQGIDDSMIFENNDNLIGNFIQEKSGIFDQND